MLDLNEDLQFNREISFQHFSGNHSDLERESRYLSVKRLYTQGPFNMQTKMIETTGCRSDSIDEEAVALSKDFGKKPAVGIEEIVSFVKGLGKDDNDKMPDIGQLLFTYMVNINRTLHSNL